jgi:hypothetical protein
MKKLTLLLFFSSFCFFASAQNSVVGKWKILETYTIDKKTKKKEVPPNATPCITTVEFLKNGTSKTYTDKCNAEMQAFQKKMDASKPWKQDGNKLILPPLRVGKKEIPQVYDLTFSGKKMTTSFTMNNMGYTVFTTYERL